MFGIQKYCPWHSENMMNISVTSKLNTAPLRKLTQFRLQIIVLCMKKKNWNMKWLKNRLHGREENWVNMLYACELNTYEKWTEKWATDCTRPYNAFYIHIYGRLQSDCGIYISQSTAINRIATAMHTDKKTLLSFFEAVFNLSIFLPYTKYDDLKAEPGKIFKYGCSQLTDYRNVLSFLYCWAKNFWIPRIG